MPFVPCLVSAGSGTVAGKTPRKTANPNANYVLACRSCAKRTQNSRELYDRIIKPHPYETKLELMRWFPVTSLLKTDQMSMYLEHVQREFAKRGVGLRFPEDWI